ncbi:hypothetical protein [Romboutsia sp. MSSM.1001216sp_RTP31141st1_G3_RTP31141_220114]|uniref:hypothetical protein n=1 Tax=unclassified Romboutsia TaxID=2626894 RepID=UPI0031B602BE
MKYASYKKGVIIDITSFENGEYIFITIGEEPGNIYTYTRLVYSDKTLILDNEYNEISVKNLNIGDFVVAYHSNIMTLSIPPQTNVCIIEVK